MSLAWRLKDLKGQVFGFLTVVKRAPRRKTSNAEWICKCTCGERVVVRSDKLRMGFRKSCALGGHFWRSNTSSKKYPSEYRSFTSMWNRCAYNKKDPNYQYYGGRGIKVCERWRKFQNFIADMGPKPRSDYTIERVNNDGNYEPGNCRWATHAEQRRNKQNTVYVEYEGQRMTLLQVIERTSAPYPVIYGRLMLGWSLEDALTVPVRTYRKKKYKVPLASGPPPEYTSKTDGYQQHQKP